MEEDKGLKLKKTIRMISKVLSYTFIMLLMIIAAFLILYVICGKIAERNNSKPPFGLYTIISPSMTPNINTYDVVFVKKTDPKKLIVGNVITFYSTNSFFGGTPITHRIVEIIDNPNSELMFRVKGDANAVADDEKVLSSNILGRVLFKVPQLGKIQMFLASKKGWLIAIIIPTLVIISYDIYKVIKLITLRKKLITMNEENKKEIDELEINNNLEND